MEVDTSPNGCWLRIQDLASSVRDLCELVMRTDNPDIQQNAVALALQVTEVMRRAIEEQKP